MTRPIVSVIIPVRNGARFLRDALDSVLAQDYPALDAIVVDGGSTDGSREIAAATAGVRLIDQRGRGLGDAWNCGIEAARGELMGFLDSDDRWVPRLLGRRVERLRETTGAQICVGMVRFALEPGHAVPKGFKTALIGRNMLSPIPGTMLVERSLFRSIGSFDTDLAIAADSDWVTRFKDRGIVEAPFPEVVLIKRLHDRNLSSDARLGGEELLGVLRRSIRRKRDRR